jgi:hypothetical protein
MVGELFRRVVVLPRAALDWTCYHQIQSSFLDSVYIPFEAHRSLLLSQKVSLCEECTILVVCRVCCGYPPYYTVQTSNLLVCYRVRFLCHWETASCDPSSKDRIVFVKPAVYPEIMVEGPGCSVSQLACTSRILVEETERLALRVAQLVIQYQVFSCCRLLGCTRCSESRTQP